MANQVVVRFALTADEYGEGMRAIMARQLTTWVGPVLGLVAITVGATAGSIVSVGAGLVVLLVAASAVYIMPGVRYRQNARLRLDQEHTFTGTGVSVRAGKERGHLPWNFYTRATETRNVYVLMRTAKSGNFVPKKAFRSDDEEASFRALLAENLRTSWRA